MSQAEEDLLSALDAHDELVAAVVRGELAWLEFMTAYDNFYSRYPLDGHESNPEEVLMLDKYAARVELHRKIWEEVLTKVTGDEHLQQPSVTDAGFIGSDEATRRIELLAAAYLRP